VIRIAPPLPLAPDLRLGRREWLWLGLAAAALVVGSYLTQPDLFATIDWVRIHVFYKEYLATALHQGRLPLWNPHIALGRPFLADVDAALFYPPHLLYVILPVPVACVLLVIAHVGFAIYGMLKLAGALALQRPVGWAMGLVFVCSAPIVGSFHSGLIHYGAVLCYLPFTVYLALRLSAERSLAALARLGLVFGLQLLGGHPQGVWLVTLATGAFLLGRRLERPLLPSLAAATLELGAMASALLAGFLLAAVSMLPLAELAQQSNRQAPSIAFSSSFAMPWYAWATFLVPTDAQFTFLANAQLYAGAVPFLAGLAGLLLIRRREMRAFTLVVILAASIAAGTATPAFAILYHVLPGLASLRIPARASVLVSFGLIVGAGMFFSSHPRGWRPTIAIALLAALSLAAVVLFFVKSGLTESSLWGRLPVVALAALLLLAWLRWGAGVARPSLIAGLLALLTAADLGYALWGLKQQNREDADWNTEPVLARWLRSQDPEAAPIRVSMPKPYARENAGMRYGWSSFTGYTSLQLGRVWTYLHAGLHLPVPLVQNTYPDGAIFSQGPFPYQSMSLRVGFDPKSFVPVMRPHPDPRVYLADAAKPVDNYHQAIALMAEGHDFHRVALVEPGWPVSLPARPGSDQPGSARIVHFAPEQLAIEVEADRPALLVIAEAWYPGWRAQVNGAPVVCMPVNAWMRGIPVPAGRSQVLLTFHSRFLALGASLSLFTLAGLVVLLIRARVRRAPTTRESAVLPTFRP
jgi:hypothetical protein